MPMSSRGKGYLFGLGGIVLVVSGVGVVLNVRGHSHAPASTENDISQEPVGAQNTANESPQNNALQSAIAQLQTQVTDLRAAQHVNAGSDSSTRPASAPPVIPQRPLAERRAMVQADFAQALANEQAESFSPSWAPAARRSLSEDLSGLAQQGGFRLVDVDCRTTQCAASIEFPDFDHAVMEYRGLVAHSYHLGCGRRSTLTPPEDRSAPVRATILFSCSGSLPEES